MDGKTRDQLQRINAILSEKLTLLNALDKQILAVSKVQEVEKEIDETETFKTCIIDTTADILTRTTPPVMKLVPSKITKDGLKKIIFADNGVFSKLDNSMWHAGKKSMLLCVCSLTTTLIKYRP